MPVISPVTAKKTNSPGTTGATVMVPLFIVNGEKIKVDTRDGRYLGRVNEK